MKTKYFLIAVLGVLLTLSSCVKDLDAFPLNETEVTPETAYDDTVESYLYGLAKLYNTMSSHEVSYVTVNDPGASQIARAFFVCQEVTTDACKIAWGNDSWVRAMNTNTWSDADNDAVFGVFFRSIQSISFCNEFLRQTTDEKLASRGLTEENKKKVAAFRAEARVIRAWYYWMAMDVFGAVPFTDENSKVGTEAPEQMDREYIYNFVVTELEELASAESALPAAQSNYPRVDKGTALGLLARIYLNAETYKGEPEWLKTQQICERIFTETNYQLAPTYAELFRGDNGENSDAYNEFLFAIPFDNKQQQSYGGTTFLTAGAIAENDEVSMIGVKGGWGGVRVDGTYIENFFKITDQDVVTETDEKTGDLVYTGDFTCADKRGATLFIKGRSNTHITDKDVLYNFQYGWSNFKFNNIPHDKTADQFEALDTFSNIDLPVIRLAEIYLIYAEACRELTETAKGLPYLAKIAERAGVEAPTVEDVEGGELLADGITKIDFFIAERARELMWESCRRTDLIRHGLFSSGDYLWPFKGGENVTGKAFDSYKELFALPSSQIKANPGLHNPEGYDKKKEDAEETEK